MGTYAKTMAYKGNGLFRQGRKSIEDDCCTGKPIEATSSGNVENVKKLVLKDARLRKNHYLHYREYYKRSF